MESSVISVFHSRTLLFNINRLTRMITHTVLKALEWSLKPKVYCLAKPPEIADERLTINVDKQLVNKLAFLVNMITYLFMHPFSAV